MATVADLHQPRAARNRSSRAAVLVRRARRSIARRGGLANVYPRLEVGLAMLALAVGMATWAVVAGRRVPIEGMAPPLIVGLVLANLVPVVGLVLLIARRVALLRADRRQGIAGSQLHTRLVVLFATMAAAPTVLVAVFAAVLFQFGVQFWFSDRAKTVLDNADRVAQTYVEDNKRRIIDDIIATGVDLRSYAIDLGGLRSPTFRQGLQFQVASRNLSEAAVFGVRNGAIVPIAQIGLDARTFPQRMAALDLGRVRVGEAQVVASAGDRVEAVVRIDPVAPVYVYVSRRVDPRVLDQVTRTQTALSEYKSLTERSRALQWRFALALLVLSLLVIALAVWFALWVADRLIAPVGRLAQAAERVGAGDFTVRVPVRNATDELGTMARAFNRMTGQIQAQQNALVTANAAADTRRRFIEAVLSGVSAGVLSIDGDGVVRLANESALALLAEGREGLVGRPLSSSVPELAGLLDAARTDGLAAAQVELTRGGAALTLAVRLAAEAGAARSYILTFDDISQQLRDQRTAAWSDVARRIAHEIKNPLTPIQLAAERIARRYGRQISDGAETFRELTDTIVRQVGDLRRMVDEFSSFARMPAPSFRSEDLADIIRQTLFLAEVATPAVSFTADLPETLPFVCDRQQIGQALTNLLKNAAESVTDGGRPGSVTVVADASAGRISVEVRDNGPGFPPELRERLAEPYVTTRARGTGLGLAIVTRIAEDHHGRLDLRDAVGGGAVAVLEFTVAEAVPASMESR